MNKDQPDLFKVSDFVFDRYAKLGYQKLTRPEKVYVCVWGLEGEVNNGGFDQYYFNSSGDHALHAEESLRAIGANHTADLVKQANALFGPAGPSPDRPVRQKQLDALGDAKNEEDEPDRRRVFQVQGQVGAIARSVRIQECRGLSAEVKSAANEGSANGASMGFALNYEDAIFLDAEALAEGGIAEAYERLLPRLREFAQQPLNVFELRDDDAPSYSVECSGKRFVIYAPEIEKASNSWGNATVASFTIVNDQLLNSTHRFYAISGGNDLFGSFLTPAQAAEAQKGLPNKRDWPYLPKDEQEWYGQFH